MKKIFFFAVIFFAMSFIVADETIKINIFQNAIGKQGLIPGSYSVDEIIVTISQHKKDDQKSSWVITSTYSSNSIITTVLIEFVLPATEDASSNKENSGILYEFSRFNLIKKEVHSLLIAVGDKADNFPKSYASAINQLPKNWNKTDIPSEKKENSDVSFSNKEEDEDFGAETKNNLHVYMDMSNSNVFRDDEESLVSFARRRNQEVQQIRNQLVKVQLGMLTPHLAAEYISYIIKAFVDITF